MVARRQRDRRPIFALLGANAVSQVGNSMTIMAGAWYPKQFAQLLPLLEPGHLAHLGERELEDHIASHSTRETRRLADVEPFQRPRILRSGGRASVPISRLRVEFTPSHHL